MQMSFLLCSEFPSIICDNHVKRQFAAAVIIQQVYQVETVEIQARIL